MRLSSSEQHRRRWLRWNVHFVFLAQVLFAHTLHAQDAMAQAAEHHQRALELYRSGNYPQALGELDAAERLHPAPLLDYNRGLVYRKMGDAAAALVHLERYRAAATALSERERGELQRVIEELQTKVGRVSVDGGPDGAEVELDDHKVGSTPFWINPGVHTLRVTQRDAPPHVEQFTVIAGEQRTIRPQLAKPAPVVPEPAQVPHAPEVAKSVTLEEQKSSDLPLILSWSAAGALVIGAAVSGALAYRETRQLDRLQARAEQDGAQIDASSRSARNLALTCDILAGAALGVAGLSLYWTLTRGKEDTERAPATAMSLEVGAGQLRLRGQF